MTNVGVARLERRRRVLLTAGLMALFGGLEWLAAWLAPPPGPPFPLEGWALAWLGYASVGALLGLSRWGWRWGPVLCCAALWPHAGRVMGLAWSDPWMALVALLLRALPARVAWGVWLLSALLAPAFVPRPTQGEPGAVGAGPDIALITVDTMRLDSAPAASFGFVQGVAVASAPWTLPSMLSLMLGQPVSQHQGGLLREGGLTRPDPELSPLAEKLAVRGYRSAAFVSNPHLREELGFKRGFRRFEHSDTWVEPCFAAHSFYAWRWRLTGRVERLRAQRDWNLTREALAWWHRTEGPRLLWVHLLGPHEYLRDPALDLPRPWGDTQKRDLYLKRAAQGWGWAQALALGLHDAEIVVLTSDHGESLGEEGRWGHGSALSLEQLLVPLEQRGLPVLGEGRVSLADLYAALLSPSPTLRPRGSVPVAGLRRTPDAAGVLEGDLLVPGPVPEGQGRPLSAELERALQALGYR